MTLTTTHEIDGRNTLIKLGSLFDGAGGFPHAAQLNGIMPVWASEIEPFPVAVTAARFPNMIQLGDITKIDGGKIPFVDIISFGSPCQSLSTAGRREGLKNENRGHKETTRSGLFFNAIDVIKQMRRASNGKYPKYIVWENVTGAFSSTKGEDFLAVLQEITSICSDVPIPRPPKGKWDKAGCIVGEGFSIAWKTYDAQYWGVPQRRRRIYLVGCLGHECAGELLFKRESRYWYSETGRGKREGTQADFERSTSRGGALRNAPLNCISFFGGQGAKAGGLGVGENVSPTLRSAPSGTNQVPDVVYCMGNGQLHGMTMAPVANTLDCMHDQQAVVYDMTHACDVIREYENASPTLQHRMGTGGNQIPLKIDQAPETSKRKWIVRRLTPLECCRLQGFPDYWTDGVNGSNTAKYRMWGNSIAIPCAYDVFNKIVEFENSRKFH